MDRNQLTGLIVMLLLLTVYFQFFAPEPPAPVKPTTETSAQEANAEVANTLSTADTSFIVQPTDEALTQVYGAFASSVKGTNQLITFENEDVRIVFASKGGTIEEVELKKHLTYEKEKLILFDKSSTSINIQFNSAGKPISTDELYFEPSVSSGRVIQPGDSAIIEFTARTTDGGSFKKIYTIFGSGYIVDFDLQANRLDNTLDNTDLKILWSDNLRKLERDLLDSRNTSTIKYFRVNDNDTDYLSETSTDTEEETFNDPLKWITIKQKFFISGIIADSQFSSGAVKTSVPSDSNIVKIANVALNVPVGDVKSGKASFKFYFGPNDYNILDDITPGFWKNVTLGWGIFGLVNKFLIIPIFNFLELYFDNYGVIIILLVLLMRLILSPLTYKSHMSMAKMKVLKPELDEIKEKHGDDMQKVQSEQMQLYQKVGINPLSGCIPMLLQMPILLAMFYFFPNAIQLRQQSFLWADDLSTYDSILNLPFSIPFYGDHISLFTLLMTLSTILYTWSNSQVQTVTGPMKSIQYIMPVMFLFFLNSYAAGLTFYYFVSNIASFGQIALIRRFVDDETILKKLEENRIKNANKKKSSFQIRLEEAMKSNQQAAKDKGKKK